MLSNLGELPGRLHSYTDDILYILGLVRIVTRVFIQTQYRYYNITIQATGYRLVISHTMEVSTLGLASDTKDFTSATKLPDVPN